MYHSEPLQPFIYRNTANRSLSTEIKTNKSGINQRYIYIKFKSKLNINRYINIDLVSYVGGKMYNEVFR